MTVPGTEAVPEPRDERYLVPPARVAAVIPARMASTRFPGKPLLEILGLPMIEHVRRRALLCRAFSEVAVATCDEEIACVVRDHGGRVIMTSPGHPAATDRVSEAARSIDCTHVVNVQGDEVLILPGDLERLVRAMESHPEGPAWNAIAPLESAAELSDPSIVKCAVSRSGRILFCSRDFSCLRPALGAGGGPVRKILGILACRKDFLVRYLQLPRTPLEIAESIDQSRILEHDIPLIGVPFPKGYPGINERREVEAVQGLLSEDPLQQAALEEIGVG